MAQEQADTRGLDDPERLAEEARAQVAKQAAELRAAKTPTETEPPTVYRP